MAAVQRKLVHKQFNSPMGLYSQQNVKETLDRELKAFGADGIEIDPEITKPLNLANSAVLRAVEEEEQVKCDAACERQSRPRQRRQHPSAPDYNYKQYYEQAMHTPVHQQQLEQIKTQYLCHQHDITIDRDTVLKINRLATRRNLHKRDHSWPPPSNDYAMAGEDDARRKMSGGDDETVARKHGTQSLTHSRSASNEHRQQQQQQQQKQEKCSCTNNAVHFAESVCKRHGIDALREKFNSPTRIIEPTPTELRQQRNKIEQSHLQKKKIVQQQEKNATNKSARVTDSSQETQRTNVCAIDHATDAMSQQTLTNVHNNMANTSSINRAEKTTKFSWPEAMEIGGDDIQRDSNNIACTTSNYADALDDCNTPKARGFSAPETKAADENIGLVQPRRYYFEQLAGRHEDGVSPKKWYSYDNISTAAAAAAVAEVAAKQKQQFKIGSATTAAINKNRQSQSLDRGRAQQQHRREQLPPLKPRAGSGAGGGCGTLSGGTSPAGRITTSAHSIKACNSDGNATSTTTPTGNSSKAHSDMSTPRMQRRAIKLATEIKICYNDMDADEAVDVVVGYGGDSGNLAAGDMADLQTRTTTKRTPTAEATVGATGVEQSKPRTFVSSVKALGDESIKKRHSSDLEHLPLPPTPQVGKELSAAATKRCKIGDFGSTRMLEVEPTQKHGQQQKQNQPQQQQQRQQQLQQQQQQRQHKRSSSESTAHTTRIIPIELEENECTRARSAKYQAPPRRDLSTVSADQLYDDACIYLRSIDLEDRTVAYIPAAITIVPSPTEEMLQRWAAGEETPNLKAGIVTRRAQQQSPTPPTPPPPPPQPIKQRSSSRTNASEPLKEMLQKKTMDKYARAPTVSTFVAANENLRQPTANDTNKRKNNINNNQHEAGGICILDKQSNAVNQMQTEGATSHNATGGKLATEQQQSNRLQTRNQRTQQERQQKVMEKVSANEAVRSKSLAAATNVTVGQQQSQQKLRAERPRGIYYTDGEYLYGPFDDATGAGGKCGNMRASKGKSQTTKDTLKLATFADGKNKNNNSTQNCSNVIEDEMGSRDMKMQREKQQKIDKQQQAHKFNNQQKHQEQEQTHKFSDQQTKPPRSPSAPPTTAHDVTLQLEQNAAEIAALEEKYGHFQQSIAKHLRQIDAYMENAKLTLNRSLQQQQQNQENEWGDEDEAEKKQQQQGKQQQLQHEQTRPSAQPMSRDIKASHMQSQLTDKSTAAMAFLLDESPLQILARQLLPKQALHAVSVTNDANDNLQAMSATHILRPIVLENMPVVERALQDLSDIKVDGAAAAAAVATKGAQPTQLVAANSNVNDDLDNNQTFADGGSILKPLMRRLVAVQPKGDRGATIATKAAHSVDEYKTTDEDGVEFLAIEHHFVPKATLAKRVTILENLDNAIVAAGQRCKPDNMRLIEIGESDKVANVDEDDDDNDEIAMVNDKIDDDYNKCGNGIAVDRRRNSSRSNIKDIAKLEKIETIDELNEVNENENFGCNNTASSSKMDGRRELSTQPSDDKIKTTVSALDKIATNMSKLTSATTTTTTADGNAPEHVIDVVANYEQKYMQTPAATTTTKITNAAGKMKQEQKREEEELKQRRQKQQQPKQQQQKRQQIFTKTTGSAVQQSYPKTFEITKPATTTKPTGATRSAPTTPLAERRTTSFGKEEATTTTKTSTMNMAVDIDKSRSMHPVTESQQRQQQHAHVQQQLRQAARIPTPPPLPPPQAIHVQQQQTVPLRAGSLPKELCKNVVSGYISKQQSQEQLVEQIIDVLQIDETQLKEERQEQQQQTEEPQSDNQKHPQPMNQQRTNEIQTEDKPTEVHNNQFTAAGKTANLEQPNTSLVSGDVEVNQQQLATFAITKINQKLCNQPIGQSTKTSLTSCKINMKNRDGETKSAHKTITAAATADAAVRPQKTEAEEFTAIGGAVATTTERQSDKRRVFTGQRGKLTLQINTSNNNHNNNNKENAADCIDDTFDTYKATYEIPSPYFKQQITWQQMIDVPQKNIVANNVDNSKQKGNEVKIDVVSQTQTQVQTQTQTQTMDVQVMRSAESDSLVQPPQHSVNKQKTTGNTHRIGTTTNSGKKTLGEHTSLARAQTPLPHTTRSIHSRSVSPRTKRNSPSSASSSPIRKYPAALIEPHVPTRAASPFGLNPIDITELIDDTAACAYHARVVDDDDGDGDDDVPDTYDEDAKHHHAHHHQRNRGASTNETQLRVSVGGSGVDETNAHDARTYLTEYVPQMEGHNIGLLVRASVVPTPPPLPPPPQSYMQQQKSVESSQTEMDKALTHSAVTHYADAEPSGSDDDNEDDGDEQHSHVIKIQPKLSQASTTAKTTPTSFNKRITLSPASSSSLASSTRSTRAYSLHAQPSKTVLGDQNVTPIHCCGARTYTPTDTTTQTLTHFLADKHIRDTSISSTITGKSQMPAQPLQGGNVNADSESEQQQHFGNEQHQQELLIDDINKQQSWDMDVAVEPAVGLHHQCITALPRESGVINRSFDNVSPRPYISIEGYKRVAWPPASEERVVREFTPQPTADHYPVSGGQQQPAQQHQPQHLQQQHQPQPQPTHYQQQPNAAPINQGPIYNNVSRAAHIYQQQLEQSPQQNYQQPSKQYQEQKPLQYAQAQFNRQHSHESAATPYGQHVNGHYVQPQQQQQQQQHQYQQQNQPQNYPHEQQQQQQNESNYPAGWKPIRAPVPKAYNEYQVGPVGGYKAEPFYPSHGQQQQQPPSQQYRATSYDQYQQQPQQQYQPHQGSQPAYSAPSYQQPAYHQPQQQQQQQQQQPSWAHNQQALQYQPAQAPPQQQQQQYQAPPPSNYQTQSYHQAQPQSQYSSVPLSNQYNSYSQPQQQHQQHVGQDQPDQRASVQPHQAQSLPQDYRGGSPGIITLRKEAPVTQKPAPVYNAQPAAISLQGGINMRGDLKWPPPEYKEAAARENEERRLLALGPVCRPRKVKRDYTHFFAKNALNSCYPSYKVPPGTQHMLA